MEYVKTDDTVYFTANFYHVASGYSVAADTTPEWFVYENTTGAAILKGTMSARTDFVGSYYGSFTASAANGFDSNSFYDVHVSGAVNNIHGMTSVKQFVLDDVFDANVVQTSGEYVDIGNFKADVSNLDTTVSSRMPTTHIDATGGSVDNVTLVDTTTTNTDMVDISNLTTKVDLESVSGVLVARTLVSADYFDPAADTVAQVTLVDTTTDVTNNVSVDLSTIESKLDENKLYIIAVSGDTVNILSDTDDLQTNQSNWLTATGFSTPNDVLSASGAITDQISGLNNFDPAVDTVANVTLVDTVTTNTDMRGTDNAALAATALTNATWTDARAAYLDTIPNLVAKTDLESVSGVLVARTIVSADYFDPATDTVAQVTLVDTVTNVTNSVTGDWATAHDVLSASGAITDQIGGLNDFDPANDAVANVTLVDTVTTNTDMRGTDNAALASDLMSVSGSIQDTLSTMDSDIYFASVKYIKDTNNTQDEFAVQWFKNDQPIGSGELTSPAISVYNTSTGAAVLEHQLMTYASPNLGVVRHNLAATMASGEPYLVETSGTIDASVHTWKTVVGIDAL